MYNLYIKNDNIHTWRKMRPAHLVYLLTITITMNSTHKYPSKDKCVPAYPGMKLNFMSLAFRHYKLALIFFILNCPIYAQDCQKDSIPPVALLKSKLSFPLLGTHIPLFASDFDDGSFDNCDPNPQFFFDRYRFRKSMNHFFYDKGFIVKKPVYIFDSTGNSVYKEAVFQLLYNDCQDDDIAPRIICKSNIIIAIEDSTKLTPDQLLEGPIWENCGQAFLSFDPIVDQSELIITKSSINTIGKIRVYAKDESNNTSYCSTKIHYYDVNDKCVTDKTAPGIKCIDSIYIDLSKTQHKFITVQDLVLSSYDDCGELTKSFYTYKLQDTLYVDNYYLNCPPNYIRVYAKDLAGNLNSCDVRFLSHPKNTVCYPDIMPPRMNCISQKIYLTKDGFGLKPDKFVNCPTDNCSQNIKLSFSTDPKDTIRYLPKSLAGKTDKIKIYATDESGNQSACLSTVEYFPLFECENDTTPPLLICPDSVITRFGWCGNEQVWPSEFVSFYADECSVPILSFDPEGQKTYVELIDFPEYNGHLLSIYARDATGNRSECSTRLVIREYISTVKTDVSVFTPLNFEDLQWFKIGMNSTDEKKYYSHPLNQNLNKSVEVMVYDNVELKSFFLQIDPKVNLDNYSSTSTAVELSKAIAGLQGRSVCRLNDVLQDADCNGVLNMLDVKAMRDYLVYNKNNNCVAKPIAVFTDKLGRMMESNQPYNKNHISHFTLGISLIGKKIIDIQDPSYISQLDHTQYNQIDHYWTTHSLNCKKGMEYEVEYNLKDLRQLFGAQGKFWYDSSKLIIQSVKLNSFGTFYHTLNKDNIQFSYFDFGNGVLQVIDLKMSIQFTAKSDFKLEEAILDSPSGISNFAVGADDQFYATGINYELSTSNLENSEAGDLVSATPNPVAKDADLKLKVDHPGIYKLEWLDGFGRRLNSSMVQTEGMDIHIKAEPTQAGNYIVRLTDEKHKIVHYKILISE